MCIRDRLIDPKHEIDGAVAVRGENLVQPLFGPVFEGDLGLKEIEHRHAGICKMCIRDRGHTGQFMSGDRLTDHIPRPLPLFHLPLHIDVEYRSRGVERLHPVLVGQRAVKGQRTIRRQFGAVGVIRSISASSRRPDFGEAFPVQLGEPEGGRLSCLLYTSRCV